MKLITSSTLKPRRKATKITADVAGPKWAEGDINWVAVSLNNFLHSGAEVTQLLPGADGGNLHAPPMSLYMAGVAGECMRLARWEDVLHAAPNMRAPAQTPAVTHSPTASSPGSWLRSLKHGSAPARWMHALWLESLHMAGNGHQVQGRQRLRHCYCSGN